MEASEKHIIKCTLAVYEESTEERKSKLKNKLEENIKNFPTHINVKPSKIFLRIIKNKK